MSIGMSIGTIPLLGRNEPHIGKVYVLSWRHLQESPAQGVAQWGEYAFCMECPGFDSRLPHGYQPAISKYLVFLAVIGQIAALQRQRKGCAWRPPGPRGLRALHFPDWASGPKCVSRE